MPDLLDVVRRLRERTDSVLVGVSGGKDSIVTLALACEHFPTVWPYFMYWVPDLGFQTRYIDYLERKFRVEIARLPHWGLGDLLRKSLFRFGSDATDLPRITYPQFLAGLRRRTGITWHCSGEKRADSVTRRGMLGGTDRGIWDKTHRAYPLYDWTHEQVYRHLRDRQIALPPDYTLYRHGNLAFNEDSLYLIQQHYPDDYARILEMFPLARAWEKRREFTGKAPGIRQSTRQKKPTRKRPLQPTGDRQPQSQETEGRDP